VVVAPNRLGALHDVIALLKATHHDAIQVDVIVMSAPAEPDLSTATNPTELERVLGSRPNHTQSCASGAPRIWGSRPNHTQSCASGAPRILEPPLVTLPRTTLGRASDILGDLVAAL
jgi:hypothetical protein